MYKMKEWLRMIGIYCIKNIKNNKKYVGQSINIEYRLRKHFGKLQNQYHENKHLQRSFNKYGKNNFKAYILEECPQNKLNEREQYWIKEMDSLNNGFNMTLGGKGINGWKADDEFKKHMSRILTGSRNPNYGNRWTDEMKHNLSVKKKGKYEDEANPNAKKVICVETLKIYNTIKDASKDIGCKNSVSISRCLKDKGNVASGFHFSLYSDEMYQYLSQNKFKYLCECYRGKNIIADLTNQLFYKKYELKEKLYDSLNYTTRELDNIMKQDEFKINNVQYILL